jgi:hypothetical protein
MLTFFADRNLRHKRKDLYEPTAEVWGMILKKHSLDETKSRIKMYKLYDKALRATLKDFYSTNDFQRFLNVLIKIGIHAQGFGFFDRSLTNLIFCMQLIITSITPSIAAGQAHPY